MDITTQNDHDRVRANSTADANREIDQKTQQNIKQYSNLSEQEITQRLYELRNEWDVEKNTGSQCLHTSASRTNSLTVQTLLFLPLSALKNVHVAKAMLTFFALPGTKISAA